MKNFLKPCYDFSAILYDFFYFCAFLVPSVNAPLIFQNMKYNTFVTRNYLQNAANCNYLRHLVLSYNFINIFENPSPSLLLNLRGSEKIKNITMKYDVKRLQEHEELRKTSPRFFCDFIWFLYFCAFLAPSVNAP